VIYVDSLMWHVMPVAYWNAQAQWVGDRNEHRWCHLFADTPEELHAFAYRIKLRPEWARRSNNGILHYDLTPTRRKAAVAAGARELNHRRLAELVRRQRVVRRFPFPATSHKRS
jgi:hypothetical protein